MSEQAAGSRDEQPDAAARRLMRGGLKAALATIDRRTGHPYASLVTVATDTDGTPLFLISRLALHTQNLAADPRASVLYDGTDGFGDPLAGGRVTIVGEARPAQGAGLRRRFLARHPAAGMYVDFPDFSFFTLTPATAHYVGGFGRIVDLKPSDLLANAEAAERIADAEPSIVAHMNGEHAEAVALYATVLLGAPPDRYSVCGVDPEGIDIRGGHCVLRLAFSASAASAGDVRMELVRLADLARAKGVSR